MKLWAWAALAAAMTLSRLASGLGIGNILFDRSLLQPGILEHHPVVLPQGVTREITNIGAIDAYRPFVDIVETHQKIDQCGLAASGRTDNRNTLAGAGQLN